MGMCPVMGISHTYLTTNDSIYNQSRESGHNNISVSGTSKWTITYNSLLSEYPVPSLVNDSRLEAQHLINSIQDGNKWVDYISSEDISSLPVGIKHNVNDVEYVLGIAQATLHKDYSELTVFVRVRLPQTDVAGNRIEIFFGANNVKLSHSGGLFGDANLVLLGDVHIPFNAGNWILSLKGGFDYRSGSVHNLTYVTIDCFGVKELGMAAEVQFSRNLILPVSEIGEPLPETKEVELIEGGFSKVPNRVSGSFQMVASDWNDVLAKVDLPPFVLTKQPDKFMFKLNDAVFDFSDNRTPDIPFPNFYHEQGLLFPTPENWRGVYVRSLEVGLPQVFGTKETQATGHRVLFGATDMIIDNYGVSGSFFAEGLIPLEAGRTAKEKAWAYSLDRLQLDMAANRMTKAEFDGRIVLPILEKDSLATDSYGLGYTGVMGENEYLIHMQALDTLEIALWQAKAQLLPNSYLEMAVIDNSFRPKAVLHGSMSGSAGSKEEKTEKASVRFQGIEFQGLTLQTLSPAIHVDYLGYRGNASLKGFPISVSDISLSTFGDRCSLGFDLALNLMEESDKGFSAKSRLELLGGLGPNSDIQNWRYEGFDLDALMVKASLGAVDIAGELVLMENHPEYGDGFSADLQASFNMFSGVSVKAKAIFGKTDFRYWYFDALADNLPTSSGVIGVHGIGGGAFYRMKRTGFSSRFSPTGLAFVPDENAGLGIKGLLLLSLGSGKAVNGGAGFEFLMNRHGGISKMGIYGEAHIMKDIPGQGAMNKLLGKISKERDKLEKFLDNTGVGEALANSTITKPFIVKAKQEYPSSIEGMAGINGYLGMEYDFDNKVFHGNIDVYVDVANGVVKGRSSGGRAGWAEVHFAPDTWYVYLGTPSDKLGLKLGVGPINVSSGGYFMVGDRIPGSPPPPQEVAQILGVKAESLHYMRDENALGNGKGFAFGLDFSVDTGDMRFLFFYARFKAGAGFDIMLKDYGEAQCINSGKQAGINGWYANGQAYAYLSGELGIRIKLFFIKKKIPIIKGEAAVLLQAKAPNPVWMRGYVGGKYELLGGMVKGNFNFKVTLGEECEFANASPLGGLKIISDLSPSNREKDLDVFTSPQTAFNLPVDQLITIPEDDGDHYYKIKIEEFTILDAKGKKLKGTISYGPDNNSAIFLPEDILPPYSKLKVRIKVGFLEKKGGSFEVVKVNGKPAFEVEERDFTTADAPDHIPLHNIVYAYPVVDQRYFLPKEYHTGYIQLRQGQDYLFDTSNWRSELYFANSKGDKKETVFNYSTSSNKVFYELPKLGTETPYGLHILSFPKESGQSGNIRTNTREETYTDGNTAQVREREVALAQSDGSVERLSYTFTTSAYTTFLQKMRSIRHTNYWGKVSSDVIYLFNFMKDHEAFEPAELTGTTYTDFKPLVRPEADMNNAYYTKDMAPILYTPYRSGPYRVSRDRTDLGWPPKRAFKVFSSYLTYAQENQRPDWIRRHFPFRYDLPEAYKIDYVDIVNQVLNDFVKGKIDRSSPYISILDQEYLFIRKDTYPTQFSYHLPDGTVSSSLQVNFRNPLPFRDYQYE
jgi:hypothetical protein